MANFVEPRIEITAFSVQDIITTSDSNIDFIPVGGNEVKPSA